MERTRVRTSLRKILYKTKTCVLDGCLIGRRGAALDGGLRKLVAPAGPSALNFAARS